MAWLVTGGAGYIGSHVADAMMRSGLDVVVVDDLSTGRSSFVPKGAKFFEGKVDDPNTMVRVFGEYAIDGVIHLAGFKFAGLSVATPLDAYQRNTVATAVLLEAMVASGVNKLVFSSSCSVYGDTGSAKVDEEFPLKPASPYGRSKLSSEWIIRDVARAKSLTHTSLRYFNVIGTRLPGVWDVSSQNIVPSVHDALRRGEVPTINGDDYNTPDGSCVRDYVDVGELADVHVRAAIRAIEGKPLRPAYNIGSEHGASVKDIMAAARKVTGIGFEPAVGPRRPGDPASIIATSSLAAEDLGWAPTVTLEQMLEADWDATTKLCPLTGLNTAQECQTRTSQTQGCPNTCVSQDRSAATRLDNSSAAIDTAFWSSPVRSRASGRSSPNFGTSMLTTTPPDSLMVLSAGVGVVNGEP